MSELGDIEREANILANQVRRLHATKCADKDLEKRVRSFVANELLEKGELAVTAWTMGLISEKEGGLLNEIVSHCSTTFYQNGKILSAIAVPVALLWKSRQDRIYCLNRGERARLESLATKAQKRVGAQQVVIGPHIYLGSEIFGTSARDLRYRLNGLMSGSKLYGRPTPSPLRSRIDNQWEMRYFLGVEVLNDSSNPKLDDSEVQRTLLQWLSLGEDAVLPHDSSKSIGPHDRTAKCLGINYLNNAIKTGEKAIRILRLGLLVEYVSESAHMVEITYCRAEISNHMEVMIAGDWFTLEYRWRIFCGESFDDFYRDVCLASRKVNDSCEEVIISALNYSEYLNAKSSTKLAWIKGIK